MKPLRDLIIAAVEKAGDAPLFLSGGVDSGTVLAASLALGRRPRCYTFTFGQYRSEDAEVAARMAAAVGVDCSVVTVPREPAEVIADIRRALSIIGVPTKTHVQCSIPFLYLAERAAADGYGTAMMAMAADDLLGTGRAGAVAYAEGGDSAFLEYRRKKFADRGASDYSVLRAAAAQGVALIDVFRDLAVAENLLARTYAELHKPRQKQALLSAFPEFWRRGAWYRPNKSLQVVSGIREAHDLLLNSSLNKCGRRAVVGLYADMLTKKV